MRRAAAVFTGLSVLQRGLLFLLLPILARAMSVEDFGIVGTLTAGYVLIGTLFGGVLEQAVVRASVRAPGDDVELRVLVAARTWLVAWAPIIGGIIAGAVILVGEPFLQVSGELWGVEFLTGGVSCFGLSYAAPRRRGSARSGVCPPSRCSRSQP